MTGTYLPVIAKIPCVDVGDLKDMYLHRRVLIDPSEN